MGETDGMVDERVEMATATGATPEQIEAEIAATRRRLAHTVDEIADRVSPANVTARGVARLKAMAYTTTHTPDGRLDTRRLALAGAAVGTFVLLIVAGKVRVRRAR